MAKKNRSVFVCQECGYESVKWIGKCICGAWNSFVEEKIVDTKEDSRSRNTRADGKIIVSRLENVAINQKEDRIDTKIRELNRVLGGGIVKGSLVLISGEPGIGKSTMIMQAANNIALSGKKVLYVTGEESEMQLKLRADRICKPNISENLLAIAETNIEVVSECVKKVEADFLIVDSIQTMFSSQIDSAAGSVSQVRICGNELMKIGKSFGIPIFIVAHVTKSGELAGPKIVEHLVDCVLHFTGERNHELRILRAYKNRFGTTSEIGAFEMAQEGLVEVENLSKIFIDEALKENEGSVIGAIYEGSRSLMIEVQALTSQTNVGFARRTSIGIDTSRLNMILAIIERKVGISLVNQDVYVNIVGGLKPEGTYVDLSVALAIISSYKELVVSRKTAFVGELGLTGEVRAVQNTDKIVKEAKRMGYDKVVMPFSNAKKLPKDLKEDIEIIGVKSLREAVLSLR